ncbi:MAG TPA: recombinase family protein [Gemmataceae bacterium]|nr:recombinase family protein [Gemmataceae bacterium]
MNHQAKKAAATLPLVRCAVYTRKSTEEGLEQEFNSLDAQRESTEAFIRSQTNEGWTCLPERYDDGGFTGGNMERPALRRLLTDIEAGKIDLVVCYKVDRLSRSLLDFAKMMEKFEQQGVSFVSITQQFNSATSMGRLVLNVLLSFAQFEREIIAERTRDKVAATRRKGKWTGGTPLLGYDLDPRGGRLLVNEDEAIRVRTIFALYLEQKALLPVVQELERRGWLSKSWQTRQGRIRAGRPFTKTSLHRLLTNVVYVGKVRYKDEIHDGEQPALIDLDTFQQVQALLRSHGPVIGVPSLHRFSSLLKGLLRCVPCDCAMTPAHTTRKGSQRYRYYVCSGAQKRGWQTCPSKSIPAAQIEELVIGQIQQMGRDPQLLHDVLEQVRQQNEVRLAEWESERSSLERDMLSGQGQVRKLLAEIGCGDTNGGVVSRLAQLQDRLSQVEQRIARLRTQREAVQQERLGEAEATRVLAGLDPAWETMTPDEQARVVQLLVLRVDYDGAHSKVAITFHPLGLKTLVGDLLGRNSEEESA